MARNSTSSTLFLDQKTSYKKARVVVLPVPFELTVSYGGGAKNGPRSILKASHYLETYDLELGGEPCQAGIHTLPPLTSLNSSAKMLSSVENKVASILKDGKIPVVLGGEHSISMATTKATLKTFPNISILHFDAHADCRAEYKGDPYSHACTLFKIRENNKRTVSVGVRSVGKEELAYLKEDKVTIYYAQDIIKQGLPIDKIAEQLAHDVYITFDIDALDPSIVEQTGTPEPGGLQWYPTLDLLQEVYKRKNVVGFDVTELAPNPAHPNADFTTAKLIYKMIGFKFPPGK